ncbi:DNA-binding protein kinase TEL1 [Aspergillus homomorphus CBS 101889]|uniref:Serine/threonine-protein kinase Tel1 n=1 Tax=Aspergillus homomorphus (strain CBS 101889) TaxID=1450537 RepID=A0A395I354_ASPHC|nr:ataxia telangiectasia mutated [Aspergillus homomorphus CBS 101889]RAL14631.1 ataxia telangiectasia mutated [Aspergillus homomorphus CBS 101889]
MGEITLEGAIALLASEKQRDRSDGLADLKHILQQNRKNSRLSTLNDKACHKLFESLFRYVSVEKSLYTRSSSKGASASRLSSCASVLRTAIDIFLHKLRAKSVRSIIDHVTETVSAPEAPLAEVLGVDYIKCLTTLLSFPPHLEHLADNEWDKIMEFCLRTVGSHKSDSQESAQSHRLSTLDSFLAPASGTSTPSRMPSRGKSRPDTSAVTEAVLCIQLLVGCPTAPILDSAEEILCGLTKLLGSSSLAGSGYQAAFDCINRVAMKVLPEQSDLARESMLNLIPVIRRLWSTKILGLKDELLITSMLCVIILTDTAHKEPSETLVQTIEGLLVALHTEYTKRPEKDILQLDELSFHRHTSAGQQKYCIWPRLDAAKSEHNWSALWVMAKLTELLEGISVQLTPPGINSKVKKRRLTSMSDDLIRDSTTSSGARRVCALQLIPFLRSSYTSIESKAMLLERLLPSMLDDNSAISIWTMVAIASIASSLNAGLPPLRPYWEQAWELASRASSSQATSRAACNLMHNILHFHLLDYSMIAQSINSMLSHSNLDGQSALSDASLALWATVVRKTAQINPGLVTEASSKISSWLRESWTIGTVTDRLYTAQVASFARPLEIVNVLFACTNRRLTMPRCRYGGPNSTVAKGWQYFLEKKQLLNYLFELEDLLDSADIWNAQEPLLLNAFARSDPNDHIILDLLHTRSEGLLQAWKSLSTDKSHHITADIVQIVVSFCVTVALYTECLPEQVAERTPSLHKNSRSLWESLCSFMHSREPVFLHACLAILSPFLTPENLLSARESVVSRALSCLFGPLAELLENCREQQKESLNSHDEETMELDDPLLTDLDRLADVTGILKNNREALPLLQDGATFQRCVTVQVTCFQKVYTYLSSPDQLSSSDGLVRYLTSLDEVDILSARGFLPYVFQVCAGFSRESLLSILESLAEKCLQSYGLERCENSHLVCLRMMQSFVPSWTRQEEDDFQASATDIYTWFVDILFAKKRASSSVLIAMTELLGNILAQNSAYTSGPASPSPRTCLFTILREGNASVKFKAGELIPQLFGRFPLADHDAIFSDVLNNLPRDPDWMEGIALRLFMLARLASMWHTLLRRSIYHMFETPAHVPSSLCYAEKCMREVARKLGLQDAKELFRLFCSQIIYTWTEGQSITSLPFSVFGYTSTKEMLSDVQDEAVGQIMMRWNEHEANELAACTGTPFAELLAASFHQAEAYSIARDISVPPSQGSQPTGVENQLKKMMGADRFISLVETHFPQVIATFFGTLDQYDQFERALQKRSNFREAHETLNSIIERSYSSVVLPANQQPSFRARYLIDELDFICKRSGYELATIWTPALATYVCRTLLDTIHPALGSLHTCSVIRKIRILVSIAGPVMLRDYPFEMVIHALRPYLIDIFCAEDALGIFWYMLDAGKDYLSESPGLMAGIVVTTLLSLRRFVSSPPADSTQQDLLQQVLAKLAEFLAWLNEFLDSYESSALSPEKSELFKVLMRSCSATTNAQRDAQSENEHTLLLHVLDDKSAVNSLLSEPVSDHIVSLLCAEKELPRDHMLHLDSIESDVVATSSAELVCQMIQKFECRVEYKLWAAKVIGKAFAATGSISDTLSREQEPALSETPQHRAVPDPTHCSKVSILVQLCNMLQNSSRAEVGLIERTMQLIVSNLSNYPELDYCRSIISPSLLSALTWDPYHCPDIPARLRKADADDVLEWDASASAFDFAKDVGLFLSKAASEDPVVGPLHTLLNVMPNLAVQILPQILHEVLLADLQGEVHVRHAISEVFKKVLRQVDETTIPHARLVINCILYLRNQPWPDESTIVDRDAWLDIDFAQAASAASQCFLPKTGLLFLEICASRLTPTSRRSSLAKYEAPPEILHALYREIDDPDIFYGIQEEPSLEAVMDKLEHESSGFKNLLFQSAQYDSEIQMGGTASVHGVLKALHSTNLQGIANSVFVASGNSKDTSLSLDSMLQTATSLRQWDIPVSPLHASPPGAVFRTFQSLSTSGTLADISTSVNECLLSSLELLNSNSRSVSGLRTAMRVLGIMTEVSDVLCARSADELDEEWQKIASRNSWLRTTSPNEVGEILTCHEALFSTIKQKGILKSAINLQDSDAHLLEIKVFRQSLEIARSHGISQASLKIAFCLQKLASESALLGIDTGGAAKFDLANVLWDQGEMAASIKMLQQLKDRNDLHKQAVPISRAELLVTLGHRTAEARLEKPETIIQDYMSVAVKELKHRAQGEDAGRVYHGFAMFCDQQLQNPDGLEDFRRVEQLRNRKEQEVIALEEMMAQASGREKEALKFHRSKTKQWFDLDDRDYQRLLRSREAFLQQCLENYLLCLRESESWNNDALRFCALWLDKSDSPIANMAVSKYLHQVPSRKFASLMNQLTSRLLDVPDEFQKMLFALIYRICVEHPFHSMYQIFASSKSKGGKDELALSRYRAANKLVDGLKNDKRMGLTWVNVHNANISYVRFAIDKPDDKLKSGAKVPLKKLATGQRLERDAADLKLPPPTMRIEIRLDCDYSDVPRLQRYQPEFTIASGVSAPKIVTAIASNGQRYKQLFKGGNDDLRQDAIMEQVFEQVSSLLKDHQATRQRNLGIRTYKVLPLTSNAGIIEFVPHTIPLHDYLMPAHQKYFPKDMKPNVCRKHISDVQTRSFEQRVRTYRQVTEHFHPVMRFFFMEKFNNPDDWFAKRLAYTRSTAAISILGHVLGLGDRHGHNILLDERTGEVVHIDLGVAFEQGRVLPVPEVVPFRLTRDLVDGMGISKTEGVFRRCCEFTLDALRQESYSIMTILDVLRYDPLYSWTVSPLRLKRMQDAQDAADEDGPPVITGNMDQRSANEPSEADRALTVVAKKLGKTLSVTATVNELIQQATDEKNLAVLYCGWAAYA